MSKIVLFFFMQDSACRSVKYFVFVIYIKTECEADTNYFK